MIKNVLILTILSMSPTLNLLNSEANKIYFIL